MKPEKQLPVLVNKNELLLQSDGKWISRMLNEIIELDGKLTVEEYISFDCPNLEDCISEKLNRPKGKIRTSDMSELEEFSCRNRKIKSLKGMENAKHLKRLDLGVNLIDCLNPLARVGSLEELVLSKNRVDDISVISKIKKLRKLNLRSNPVKDLNPIKELISLKELILTNIPARNFKHLSALRNLELLSVGWTFAFPDHPVQVDSKELCEIISSLKNLKKLHLLDEPIPPTQIKQLRKNLPNCQIPRSN